jgi:hypothetical protein
VPNFLDELNTTEDRLLNIEMNITGTLPPTGILKPNLKTTPSLFMHEKSAQSVNHHINTQFFTSDFGCKNNIGSISEGSVPVIFL